MELILISGLVSLLGGIAVGLQGPLSSIIGQNIGILESVFIVHLGGAVLAGFLLLFSGGGNLSAWRSVPWYALMAGFLGLLVISSVNFSIPRIGVSATIAFMVTAQLLVSMALDHYGLLEVASKAVTPTRFLGAAALIFGTWLITR
jgi:bacterial/archaeal transporter family-2 protein